MAEEWGYRGDRPAEGVRRGRRVDGVDLRVRRGSVFALLGPNGAGKTTMVRILATLVRPDAGRALVAGFDIAADRQRVRRSISLTGQDVALDGLQTGEENLHMMARLSGALQEPGVPSHRGATRAVRPVRGPAATCRDVLRRDASPP